MFGSHFYHRLRKISATGPIIDRSTVYCCRK